MLSDTQDIESKQFDNVIELYQNAWRENFALPALTDYGDSRGALSYGDMAAKIARLHILMKRAGIRRGDKIALVGRNSSAWVVVFMATVTYGATVVPILHDFSHDDICHIVQHSESRMLFAAGSIYRHLDFESMPGLCAAFSLEDFGLLAHRHIDGYADVSEVAATLDKAFDEAYPQGFGPDDISYDLSIPASHTAIINYTSGTTGFSKGVMLSLDNLAGNLAYGVRSNLHYRNSRALSFLPLAHAYGCAFDMVVPLAVGTHVTLVGKTPSPRILLQAFEEVRPSLILCVPLILEKIYKRMIVPVLNKRQIKTALAVPGLRLIVYGMIRKRLVKAFGGEFEEVIVGGAPISREVEAFLHRIRFPFTVGYGMTECAPLISHTPWRHFSPASSGHVLDGIMEVAISSEDPENIPGEILVRGRNVMQGYYKEPDLTADAISEDGWLHTGDMGTVDHDGGTIRICGRYKTMILGPSGQNIYPEAIEDRVNALPYVLESLVIEREGHLQVLIVPDTDALERDNIMDADERFKLFDEARVKLNGVLAPFERIDSVEIMPEEFEKTPKRSIKRYLYTA